MIPVSIPVSLVWGWHIHHDCLMEMLTTRIEERQEFIRKWKPLHEQETRLRLLRPVQHSECLPSALNDAGRIYLDAIRAYEEMRRQTIIWPSASAAVRVNGAKRYVDAMQACNEARRTYDEALRSCTAEIEALHRKECPDCSWDGKTIFPR